MVNEPAGTTSISGHLSHSLKLSLGFSARSAAAASGQALCGDCDTVTAPPQGSAGDGTIGGATIAPCFFLISSSRTRASRARELEGYFFRNSSSKSGEFSSLMVCQNTSSGFG